MRGNIVIDGRNIYDGNELREAGFVYEGIGVKQKRGLKVTFLKNIFKTLG